MLPHYIEEYILGFVDFHTMIKLISVPFVYRYLLRLARFVDNATENARADEPILAKLEKYYHLNGYAGLTVFDIDRFIRGFRIAGNEVSINLTRQLWINEGQYHRIYGPSLIYGSITHKIFKSVWYYHDMIHRVNNPAITIYHENGNVKCELYYYFDRPYSYNGYPTAIEYTEDGQVKAIYWHDRTTGRPVRAADDSYISLNGNYGCNRLKMNIHKFDPDKT